MELLPDFHSHQTKHLKMLKRLLASKNLCYEENKARVLIHKFLRPRLYASVLKFLGQLLVLTIVVMSFPRLNPKFSSFLSDAGDTYRSDPAKFDMLPLLFHDLANEGLLKGSEKALFLSNQADYEATTGSRMILFDNEMDYVSTADSDRQSSIQDDTFDFIFTFEFHDGASHFIDRTLKVGGIAVIHLRGDDDPNNIGEFKIPSNYRITYIRRFDSTVLAIKKTGSAATTTDARQTSRRLLEEPSSKKKEALKHLEDVLLEPPRAATGRSSRYQKKTRYLPDLMGDNLEGYPRRVFIDVGSTVNKEGESAGTEWFIKNYPTRNLDFEMYKMETVGSDSVQSTESENARQIGMSEWLRNNVKEEEFVVMKADAEVVEEMIRGQATGLVDELFFECMPKGKKNTAADNHGASNDGSSRNKRAYWECLALYGRLRDYGVAVHQWWG